MEKMWPGMSGDIATELKLKRNTLVMFAEQLA
jgi:hypothetical protein